MSKLHDTVLAEIEAFLLSHGMPHSTFGTLARRDPSFVTRVRGGRQLRSDTIDELREFMSLYDRPRPRMRARAGNARAVAA